MSKYDDERKKILKEMQSSNVSFDTPSVSKYASERSSGKSKYAAEREALYNPPEMPDNMHPDNAIRDFNKRNASQSMTPFETNPIKRVEGQRQLFEPRQAPGIPQLQYPTNVKPLPGRDIPVVGPVLRGLDAVQQYTEPAAKIAGQLYTPGAGPAAVAGFTRGVGSLISKAAPKIGMGSGLGARVARGAINEGVTSVPLAAGQSLAANPEGGLREAAKQGLIGGALGAVGGAAAPLIGKGLRGMTRTNVDGAISPRVASSPDAPIETAPAMKGNWFTNLFGNQGVGASAFGSSKRLSKGPLTTADQLVKNSIKNDKDGVKAAVAAQARATYQNFVDQLSPLTQVSKQTYDTAMDAARSNNIANTIVRDKFVTPEGVVVGEGLERIFKKVARGQDKQFIDYLTLRHAKTRLERGERVYDESLGMTPDKVQQRMEMYDKRHPGFSQIAQEWDGFNDNVLKTLGVDEGLISPEAYAALREKNPNYSPMNRQFSRSEKPGRSFLAKTTSSSFTGQKAPLKKVSPTGSIRDIVDPRKSTIENVGAWTNAAMRNRTMQSMVDAVKRDTEAFKGVVEIVQKPNQKSNLSKILADEVDWKKVKKNARENELNSVLGINQDDSLNIPRVPVQIGNLFDSHGMIKGGLESQLDDLITLLKNGIDESKPFHSARISDTGPISTFKGGSFIVTSGPGQMLKKDGIKNVIVNDGYYHAVPDLQRTFPDVNFIRADELPEMLDQLVKNPNYRVSNEVADPQDILESLDEDFKNLFKTNRVDGENIVRAMVKGEPVYMKVHDPELVKTLIGMGPQASNVLIDVMSAFSNATKKGATGLLAPMFAVKGATMDLVQSAIQARNPAEQAVNTVYAIFSGVGDRLRIPGLKNLAEEFRRAGGEYSAALKGDRKLNRQIGSMKRNPLLSPQAITRGAVNVVKTPFKIMESIGNIAENAPRMAAYKSELKRLGGERTPDNIRQAMSAARESTVNFSRKGSLSRDIEAFVPYNNAAVQGTYRVMRAFKQNPIRTTAAVATLAVLPKMYEYMQFHDDPDYQKLPARERYRFLIVGKNEDGSFTKIPMEPAYNSIGELTIEALRKYADQDPNAFKGAADALSNSWLPPAVTGALQGVTQGGGLEGSIVGSLNATIVAPAAAVAGNKSFTGAPIVSQRLAGNSPAEQYDERTSTPAKKIGQVTGMSPLKVDYLLRSYGGDPARLVLPLLSDVGAGTPRNTLLKNFIVDPVFTNTLSNDFYKLKDKITQAESNSRTNGTPMPAWYKQGIADYATSSARGKPTKRLSLLASEKRDIQADKTLSAQQKADKLRDVQARMNEIYLDTVIKMQEGGVPK